MDTYQVRFCETTQGRYDELTKEPGTLYFTSDTKRLYKGNQLFASELTEVYDNNSKFLGYAIAGQTDKPLAPEAKVEELRTNKLDKADVVAPSTSATAGQAADAKAVGDALSTVM